MTSQDAEHQAETAPEPAERVSIDRRRTLYKLSLAFPALLGGLVGLPFVGFLFAPLRRTPPDVWRDVGAVTEFDIGETVKVAYVDPQPLPWAGFSAETAVYLRRLDAGGFVAFSVYCTHTGCPVHWVETTRLFFCPCHGGAFHDDGRVAAGPPPRPLERHETRVRNGRVEVRSQRIPVPPPGA